ncbi:adenylate/guanylate cyclase domain-containing protein [Nisaea acidiphila]|uniref:Adenylate/guanylate cyclase domain-containing protein n=1 Tax=Nisaea acidiphila TaxID=1862145 RepID=A0A9J7AJW8_9PROT|nr:adenylate/guanylate cyclase domain-containing protein [Nisaea acidiphila]UUX47963.1 adenylate/guanylate cyclase domain-containing protein [Nisaea acidiphila]
MAETTRQQVQDKAQDRLPGRVEAAIREQEAQNEVLIGWVQLTVVSIWAILYGLSPKTFAETARFEPIPWVLSAYFGFTVLRLVLSYRRLLPPWFLALSVIGDIALLMITIWSFHLQYEQPASFYLKAPTVLYVFIFIALRSFRLEVGYVLLAGIGAALGWLALVAYAMIVDPSDPMVTRDYVHYLTSNSVLIGAEFDKVLSILMVTAILAVAIHRGRRLLVRAVAEGMAARELSRFFAPEVARKITGAEAELAAGSGDHRDATILYIDIRGFTALSARLEPQQILRILADYQALVGPVLRRHRGSIDKFLGDGVLATFGAAVPDADHAANALRAMRDMLKATRDWTPDSALLAPGELRICMAAASGQVVFGAVGDAERLEYTVIGDAVNRAAKLEKHTKRLGVRAVCDHATRALAGTAPDLPVLVTSGEHAVEGIDGGVEIFEVREA